jgi:Peptidase family M28
MIREMNFPRQKNTAAITSKPVIRSVWLGLCLLGMLAIFGLGLIRDFPGLVRNYLSKPGQLLSISQASKIDTLDNVWVMIGQIEQSHLQADMSRLTGAEPICLNQTCYTIQNRLTGSEGLNWAESYVQQQLTAMGYSVVTQEWSLNGYSDKNLLIKKTGKVFPGQEIYFVAHLDGENCPAADDNASGVVSLLELARVISHRDFNRTIVILFSTGEEQGTLGVKSYLDQLTPEQLAAIEYVVNVDMIGYDANADGRMELFNGTQPLDFVEQLMGIISDYHLNLQPEIYSDCG